MKATLGRNGALLLAGAGLVAAAGLINPAQARADEWSFSIGKGDRGFGFGVYHGDRHLPRVGVGPCHLVPREIWHEPVYEIREVVVQLPAEVIRETVPVYGRRGRIIGYREVERVIRPARSEVRQERVLVRAGFTETVYDEVCAPIPHRRGHLEIIKRDGPYKHDVGKAPARPHPRWRHR